MTNIRLMQKKTVFITNKKILENRISIISSIVTELYRDYISNNTESSGSRFSRVTGYHRNNPMLLSYELKNS